VTVVIVASVVVTKNNKNNNEVIVDAPTRSPTFAPTPLPPSDELAVVLDAIGSNPVTAALIGDLPNDPAFYEGLFAVPSSDTETTTTAANVVTPQQRAMSWLLYEDTMKDPARSTYRWALASIYMQTGGIDGLWTSSESWLSPSEVCDWEHVTCELNGDLQELDFDSVNLVTDKIPIELALLTEIQSILLPNNQISGTIDPDIFSVQNLPRLGLLYLNNNTLTGPIPEGLTRESGGLRKCYTLTYRLIDRSYCRCVNEL
jgi:hypothetical protein